MEHLVHIKNMVCPRCIATVTEVLGQQGLQVHDVKLGEARVSGDLPAPQVLHAALAQHGFALLQEKEEQLTAQIKATLLEYLLSLEKGHQPLTTSAYLAQQLGMSYQHLSKVFSQHTGTTLEKYFIRLKIERVKELLSYGELTLSEIAFQLQYSSVQHLSNQFKKVTGVSVTAFKQSPQVERLSWDALSE